MGDMNFCLQSPNATIGNTDITWAQAESNALHNLTSIAPVTYLRPDTAGALLPWIYTVIILVLHVPVVFVRVVRWQTVQYWCLVSTFFTIVLYTQAYVSTKFDAAKVLVWTPLILVIDAGSMLQVFFLVIEAKKESAGRQVKRCAQCSPLSSLMSAESQRSSNLWPQNPDSKRQTAVVQRTLTDNRQGNDLRPYGDIALAGNISSGAASAADANNRWYCNGLNYAAVIAAVLFLMVLVLQLLGLAKAAQAAKASSGPPLVSWCSPFFQPFGIAVVDGNCNIYHISQSAHKGIGCITIPGQWQQQWLKGTIAGISIELFTEVVDLLVLSLVNGERKIFDAVKMKRPWATIFSGLVVLLITLTTGVSYSLYLPPGVSERAMVLMNAQGPASYSGNMTSAGLRGTVIGWNDGLFESWKGVYFGSWVI